MTRYHFLDDSGDPGLRNVVGSSSHFALAMVELPERSTLPELARVRQLLHFPSDFELKYHKMALHQKEIFFKAIQHMPFRVRAVVLQKPKTGHLFSGYTGPDIIVELITELTLRASPFDIANDVLILDGTTPLVDQNLRIKLSQACRHSSRERPFKKIVSANSSREDGLQLADMLVGAIRHYIMNVEISFYETFAHKVVDLWILL